MKRYVATSMVIDLEGLIPILTRVYSRMVQEHVGSGRDAHPPTFASVGPDPRLLLRMTEVAEALSISRSSAYTLIRTGEIPVVRIGRSTRVSAEALRQWIAARSESL